MYISMHFIQIVIDIPFKYVTIKLATEKDENNERSLGKIVFNDPSGKDYWKKYSIMNPNEFSMYFKDDFTKLAGSGS
jgi:hypothetical protein